MNLNFNFNKLNRLLKSFYQLTNIKIAIFDIDYNEVISYPLNNCKFCSLIQNDKNGYKKCMMSNKKAFEHCLKTDELYTYTCHANLIESMINLKIDDTIVGFIMFGQVTNIKNKEERFNKIKDYNFLINNITKEMVDEIAYVDDEKLISVSTILIALAKYTISEKFISIKQEKFINDLNDFIIKNIDNASLNVYDFTRYFNMSKTTFYTTMDKYIGKGIARYLKEKRIERAKELLVNTNKSLNEISSLVGFNDYNYFCKVFKEEVKQSAVHFRKSVRTNLK